MLLGETHQDSSLGSVYKVTAVGTNQVEHLECKHAACRRGCSALVFPSPFTVTEILTEHKNLSVVHNISIYCSILAQETAAEGFQKRIKSKESTA